MSAVAADYRLRNSTRHHLRQHATTVDVDPLTRLALRELIDNVNADGVYKWGWARLAEAIGRPQSNPREISRPDHEAVRRIIARLKRAGHLVVLAAGHSGRAAVYQVFPDIIEALRGTRMGPHSLATASEVPEIPSTPQTHQPSNAEVLEVFSMIEDAPPGKWKPGLPGGLSGHDILGHAKRLGGSGGIIHGATRVIRILNHRAPKGWDGSARLWHARLRNPDAWINGPQQETPALAPCDHVRDRINTHRCRDCGEIIEEAA